MGQSVQKVDFIDTTYLNIVKSYIKESRQLRFLTDSTGIVQIHFPVFNNGTEVYLEAIKQERASYFTKINIPTLYTYVDSVLVFINNAPFNTVKKTEAEPVEIEKITQNRFFKMEEDRGAFVSTTVDANGVIHKDRYLNFGNSRNGVSIRLYKNGKRETIKPI